MRRRTDRRGFTLVEMLVAVLILAAVGAAMYSLLAQSVELWHRASAVRPEMDLDLALEKIAFDLRNAFRRRQVSFKGARESFTFHALVKRGKTVTPAMVRYAFDAAEGTLARSQEDFGAVLGGGAVPGARSVLAREIVRCAIEYYDSGKEGVPPAWRSRWQEACLPDAVKVSLDYGDKWKTRNIYRIVAVPAGGCHA